MKNWHLDLHLPGRETEPDDYEAQGALRTLLEVEHFKHTSDGDLLAKVEEQIVHNLEMLNRVYDLVCNLKSGSDDEDSEDSEETVYDEPTGPERTDTRTIDDFLARINRRRKEEHRLNMMPLKGGKGYV